MRIRFLLRKISFIRVLGFLFLCLSVSFLRQVVVMDSPLGRQADALVDMKDFSTITSTQESKVSTHNDDHIPEILNGQFENQTHRSTFGREKYLSQLHQYVTYYGKIPSQKKFLTIGIPTIHRKDVGIKYIQNTIESLVNHTDYDNQKDITIMLFLADSDLEYNNQVRHYIGSQHSHHLKSGFIGILEISKDAYPPLDGLKRNYKDPAIRVAWRAKQVVDFAYMFYSARNLSQYYMQLEDDVISSKQYVKGIRDYVKANSKEPWVLLEFCELGFIGKLFRASDLERLASFLLMFYEEQPVDWLYTYFVKLYTQTKRYLRKPTLFQHMGLQSSFSDKTKNKPNKLRSKFFADGVPTIEELGKTSPKFKYPKSDHPPATVYTSLTIYKKFKQDLAYAGTSHMWVTQPIIAGDSIHLIFQTPQNLSRIVVETGTEKQSNDYLRHGTLSVGPKFNESSIQNKKQPKCEDLQEVDNFGAGVADAKNLQKKISFLVKCVKITITAPQEEWLIVNPILVYLQNNTLSITNSTLSGH